MKTVIKIESLSHDDLVNLFSTALYGNPAFDCVIDSKYEDDDNIGITAQDCYEDKIAKILLNGGKVEIVDLYSNGETYGNNKEAYWDGICGRAFYPICLNDIMAGLELAAKKHQYLIKLFAIDDGGFDLIAADMLLQYITFNELIYG